MVNKLASVSFLLAAGLAGCAPAPPPGPPYPLDVSCAPVFDSRPGAPRKLALGNHSAFQVPIGTKYDVTMEPQRVAGGPYARIELAEPIPAGQTYITRTAFGGNVIGCTARVVFHDNGDTTIGVP